MPEMNRLSRFFVNFSSSRRNVRRARWLSENWSPAPGTAWLELGCGNADLASRLVETFRPRRYLATDFDPEQVAAAGRLLSRRYPSGVPPALELAQADMLKLDQPDTSFDAVLAFTSIHHAGANHHDFGPIPQALGEIDRVLRPSGILVYEEFLHRDRIREWLDGHGYTAVAQGRRWRTETVVRRKPAGPA